jgi:inositol-1,4,5-trisphosphate 5-phosphatase
MYNFFSVGLLCLEIAEMCFVPAKGKEVYSGNIEAVCTKEKAKFPQDFFPEVRLCFNRNCI